jgi:hypothetical protein
MCSRSLLQFDETLRWSIFANGVDQETEPDAAIPPKNGRT